MSLRFSRRNFIRLVILAAHAIAVPFRPLLAKTGRSSKGNPDQISLTAIAVTTQEVDIVWSKPPASRLATRYFLKRNGQILATVSGDVNSYVDKAVQPGQTYSYGIEAELKGSAELALSAVATVSTPVLPETPDIFPPSEPEDFLAVSFPGYILLDWYASNDDTDVTCYLIQRNGQRLALINGGSADYRDTTVEPGIHYTYVIEAIDTVGHRSLPASATAVGAPRRSIFLPNLSNQGSIEAPQENVRDPSAVLAVSTQLRRYPYLTDMVGPYVTINWATDNTLTTGSVTYGEVGVEGVSAHTVVATRFSMTVGTTTEYQWKALLQLKPDTQYQYRIFGVSVDLLNTDPTPTFWTQLPAGSNKPFSFVVLGDWGDIDNAATEQASLMSSIAQTNARFAFTTGDNAYPSSNQTNYGDLVQTGASTGGVFGPQFWALPGRSMALFPALGNHGFSSSSTTHPHVGNWPQQMATQLCNGRYVVENYSGIDGITPANYPSTWYAFSVGNARFYVLEAAWADTNLGTAASPYQANYDYHWVPGRPQYQWLVNDLATHPTTLKFAIFHFPLYSDNRTEKSDTYLQGANNLEGLLTSYGVQFALNGHAHLYQRNVSGSLNAYVVGATGVKLAPADNCSAVDAYALGWSNTKNKGYACGAAPLPTSKNQVYNYLLVTVSGTTVTVSPRNAAGQVFDQQVFNFSAGSDTTPPSVPIGLRATAVSTTQVSLAWSAATDNGPDPALDPYRVAGYDIYRYDIDGNGGLINGVLINSVDTVLSYSDTTVSPNTTYAYRIATRDTAANISALSSAVNVTTPSGATATPTNTPTATAIATNTPTLTPTNTSTPTPTPIGPTATNTSTPTPTNTSTSTPTPIGPTPTNTLTPTPTNTSTPTPTPTSGGPPIFQDGFESGMTAWTSSAGLVVQNVVVHSGANAAQGNTTTGATYAKKTLATTYSDAYARIYFNLISYTSQVNLLRLRTAADGSLVYLFISTTGRLSLRNDVGLVTFTSTTSVTSGSGWHALELHCVINGTSSSTEVWLDNVKITDLSVTTDIGTTPIGRLQIGEVQTARTYNVVFDDVVFNTVRIGP